MPGPVVGPCGGANQPVCPPQPAAPTNETILYPETVIAQAWFAIDKHRRKELEKQFSSDGHWYDGAANVLGQAKFGGGNG